MFGKIKGKLKDVFSKSSDEVFDEDVEEEIVEESPTKPEDNKKDTNTDSDDKDDEKSEESSKEKESENEQEEDNSKELEESEKEEEEIESEEEKPEKKGFFSRVFGKKKEETEDESDSEEIEDKEEKDLEELKELEDEMLKEVPVEEKEAIKEHKDLDEKQVEEKKEELDKAIEKEETQEKEELKEIPKIKEEKKEEKFSSKNVTEIIEEKESKNKSDEKPQEIKTDKEIVEETLKEAETEKEELEEEKSEKKGSFFSKTFSKLTSKKISVDDFEKIWLELEMFLLEINIAYEIVQLIEEKLRESVIGENLNRFQLTNKIREVMIEEVREVLEKREGDLLTEIRTLREKGELVKILVLGVNGTGKTTSIAKVVHLFKKEGLSVVVAAADTFRAAAVEQLDEHSKKVGFKLIQHKGGSDPAAVAYDAIEHANAKNLDVVLIDTAGRMPNNSNLMQELNKIQRVANSQINLFIGDSISGNDLIEQIELFDKVVGINGAILTKTDTDERPGSIVSAAYSIEKPIYYLGVGQTYDDLIKFNAELVAEKLFEIDEDEE